MQENKRQFRSTEVVETLADASRVVVKVGAAWVTRDDGRPAVGRLGYLSEQLWEARKDGRQMVLVSAGAFGIGAQRLGHKGIPKRLAERQVCAAVGQVALISLYDHFLGRLGLPAAQVLLTQADLSNPERLEKLRFTIDKLLAANLLPVINENDAVATDKKSLSERVYKDNEELSATLAVAIGADVLAILTTTDCLAQERRYLEGEAPPKKKKLGAGSNGRVVGATVETARYAAERGVMTFVADGDQPRIVQRLLEGEKVGLRFGCNEHGVEVTSPDALHGKLGGTES